MKTIALIVAAGKGVRLGSEIPKQYLPLAEKMILTRTLAAFLNHPQVDAVKVVIRACDKDLYATAAADFVDHPKLLSPVHGGERRQGSVRFGLESLAENTPHSVLIHDGARPFITENEIRAVIDALKNDPAVTLAVPITDTLKRVNAENVITENIDRSAVYAVQTPQGFHFSDILKAHQDFIKEDVTDDNALAEKLGLKIRIINGLKSNFKVTHQEDIARGEAYLMQNKNDIRTGMGFDVHAFTTGDSLWLCGVEIPHTQALKGHSDADVALHALTDAILGTIAAGDIGLHFPPSDPQWKGAPSSLFLEKALSLLAEKGGVLNHVDLTIICEAPKLTPHRDMMQAKLATLLGLSLDRVNVKATTTEKLGFTGRSEGIAAQAIATVALS
ncbi:MAG: bifunctional 2-C-methyl-D-erythritol 4-phosphate cytidylyltransferase/2-C-methyl-D-erythritol 2,4-cyclodiphosphate synthase [Alphaproteobacteria bacterium]